MSKEEEPTSEKQSTEERIALALERIADAQEAIVASQECLVDCVEELRNFLDEVSFASEHDSVVTRRFLRVQAYTD
jgi:hypothetical protein